MRILKRGEVGDPPIPLGSWVVVTRGRLDLRGRVYRLTAWDPSDPHEPWAVASGMEITASNPPDSMRRVVWLAAQNRDWVSDVQLATPEEIHQAQLSQLAGGGL